ncbi:MAG: putative ABC transporter permease subunit, partial [Longimicrobiales bacterium]
GFGAHFPNFETENVAEIPTSYGGLLFMMAAVLYLGAVVGLEAWPVYLYLSAPMRDVAAPVLPMVLGLGAALAVTVAAIVVPLRLGVRRVEELGHG